jgi:hypothetical protein
MTAEERVLLWVVIIGVVAYLFLLFGPGSNIWPEAGAGGGAMDTEGGN